MTFEVDTIVAPATPMGRSALALIRLSGPKTKALMASLANRIFVDRKPTLCQLVDRGGQLLDEVVVTLFEGPKSYTGEDLVEISCHGNPIIVERIVSEIVSRGTRLASPGEFTQRALANEKLSPDQVEGLEWLLNSTTFVGAQAGLRAKLGQVGASVEALRADLIDVLGELEAELDFSEDEVGAVDFRKAASRLFALAERVSGWIAAFERNERFVRSCRVVLVGRPNSGKSSLFNALIGFNKAIVHETAGTTRDLVEHEASISGMSIVLVDTAGIRAASDEIERLGIGRSKEAARGSSVVIWACDRGAFDDSEISELVSGRRVLRVRTKSDVDLEGRSPRTEADLSVSSKTGAGLDVLRASIVGQDSTITGDLSLTSERQRDLAALAVRGLQGAAEMLESGSSLDQVVAAVNEARLKIEEITGRVTSEDVLGSIFSKFCIGK